MKVVKCGEKLSVKSEKSENGQLDKRILVLQELGSKYADEYQCTLLGEVANSKFTPGQLVVVSLRFSTHENNGVYYQDIMANEIVPIA